MSSVPVTFDQDMPEIPQPGANPNVRFLAGDVSQGARSEGRWRGSFAISVVTHVAGFFVILAFITAMPPPAPSSTPRDRSADGIIWTQAPGPGGGGGGGGNRSIEPPRKAELPGQDKVTVPVAKPPKAAPEPPKEVRKAEPPLSIPAVTTSAGVEEMPGALSGLPNVPSLGSGTAGGAGTGSGTGIGSGRGSGLGDGHGGGTGGGAFRPGNGVTMPSLISDPKPSYTAEAMRAKIQGVVMVEAVVREDGTVGQVQVVRSLDRTFGLDQEAIKTVKRWRFAPGTRFGKPVPVLVEIELTFTLR